MSKNTIDIPVFRYESADFLYIIRNDNTESKFDAILKNKWKNAEENGVLRYKLNIKEWKILDGSYRFLAQLNPDRASNRRAPEEITSMSQPFNANRFNFTKIASAEILFDIGDGSGNDVVVANVSPMELGHSMFLSERLKCLPQRITEYSLLRAMELLLLSNSIYLRIVFNSLCAHASVNHLHWHLYYLGHQMLLEDIELQHLEGPLYLLKDYPAKGFCLKLSWFTNADIQELKNWAFLVINYLQENNIPHNVFLTRARTKCEKEIYDDIRVYIWARKPNNRITDTQAFMPAVCEFFGHLSVRSEEEYRNLSEDKVSLFLKDVTAEVCTGVQQALKQIIVNQMIATLKE